MQVLNDDHMSEWKNKIDDTCRDTSDAFCTG